MQEDRPLPAPSFFFHPDCHCRLRSCTESALRLVGYTTGRDLHPALKILIRLFCGVFPDMPCRSSKQFLQTLAKETPRTPGSGRDNGAQKLLRNKKTPERTHSRAVIQHARADAAPLRILPSFIQTILSASESHRIMPCGSWAIPPVGTCTLP